MTSGQSSTPRTTSTGPYDAAEDPDQPSSVPKALQGEGGLQRRDAGVPALPLGAALGPAASPRRLDGVAGQHAITDRRAGVERDPRQAVSHGVTDIIEVRRTAPDD